MFTKQLLFDFFPLITALTAMIVSQTTKLTIFLIKQNYKFTFSSLLSAGGMPSTHSSLITSIAISIGLTNGFSSSEFFLAVILSLVVIYDAQGIRHSVGEHAKILNKYVLKNQKKVNEYIGHTVTEVSVGIIIGIITALAMYKLIIL